tara:strand:- start:1713 stop:2150 length:438 start_codon:yes stop_codon:yes gene_type:complete
MATINVDNSMPLEFLMVPCGEFSSAFSSAFNVCKPMDGTFNIESLIDITSDGVLNIDTLSRIGVNKALAIEIIQGISQFDRTISIEFMQDLSVDSIIPLSFLGEGIPIEVRSWILSSREKVYVLDSRDDNWVLLDRNDVLRLLSR